MALYLFELKHLVDRCINSHRDFFDKVGSSHRYFDHKTPMYRLDIIEIITYHKIIEKELGYKYEVYTDKKRTI